MGYAILGFLGFIVAFTLMVYSANVITSKYVTRILDARFTSMEQIVNDKRVPEAWLHPFRQRLTSALYRHPVDEEHCHHRAQSTTRRVGNDGLVRVD